MKRALMEMFGLEESKLGQRANAIGKRYVQTWQKGKKAADPTLPGILTDLAKLLKDSLPELKKEKGGAFDVYGMGQDHMRWLKSLKPGKISGPDYSQISKVIDDLRMWLG